MSHPTKGNSDLYSLTTHMSNTSGLPEPLYQNQSFYTTYGMGSLPPSGKIETQQDLYRIMQAGAAAGRYATLSGTRVAWWQLGQDAFPAAPTFP